MKDNSKTVKPPSAREVWNQIKDLPKIEDILKSLDLSYDSMEWDGHPHIDVSDWHLRQEFVCEGKSDIQEFYCLRPELVLDLIVGEITRRMGGCPCDKRLEAWRLWKQEK